MIERARHLLTTADDVLVLTGAGISAESGVPTFRGEDGLWRRHRPEELATPQAFARDPRLVWEWYGWRRERIAPCRPNAAHVAVARLALARGGVRIVTQNVDALHTRAARLAVAERGEDAARDGGEDAARDGGEEAAGDGAEGAVRPALPLELHGSIFRVRCTQCGERREHREPIDASSPDTLPRCVDCDGLLRPDVVWFGESLDPDVLSAASRCAARADVCVVIGTSALVHPAAGLPLETRAGGGDIIEVNPDATPLTSAATVSFRARAGDIVPEITDPDAVR